MTITSNPNNIIKNVVVARAAASSSPQATALSNALNDSEKTAMEAFRASGGDDARAKQLLVEAARTKVTRGARCYLFARPSALSLSLEGWETFLSLSSSLLRSCSRA